MDSVKLYTLLSFLEICVGIEREREREKRERRRMITTTTTGKSLLSLSIAMKNRPPVCAVVCYTKDKK